MDSGVGREGCKAMVTNIVVVGPAGRRDNFVSHTVARLLAVAADDLGIRGMACKGRETDCGLGN